MSILTEKQVEELTKAILDTTGTVLWSVREWNEKQPTRPALPLDWNLAPKWADRATVSVTWDGVGLTDTVVFSRTKRPVKSHPHAALIAKFAEVAARRPDPWVEFEYKNSISGNWEKTISSISFFHDAEYRYIGEPNAQ